MLMNIRPSQESNTERESDRERGWLFVFRTTPGPVSSADGAICHRQQTRRRRTWRRTTIKELMDDGSRAPADTHIGFIAN